MIQSQNQTVHIGTSNTLTNAGANLKYICEVCGELFNSIDLLKQHLSVHTTNAKDVLNSKISSILSLAKNKKICSSAISIPQSMTVFNLKDISSKIESSQQLTAQPTTVTSPPIITNINANLINKNDNLSSKIDQNNNYSNNSNNALMLKTVFQLEEPINFYELKNEKLIDLTSNFVGSSQQIALFPTSELSSLPYHYSENENIYVCNLCNCTYDSLRSIKAHLWKHSGHRELCYPINDHNRIAESTGKPIVTLKSETTSRKTIRSLQINSTPNELLEKNGSKCEQVRQSSGGICSALLEVIEKLRESESIQKETKRKRKANLVNKTNKEPKIRKKRKTSQKVNQLIQMQDEINMNNIKQQEVIKNMLNDQETECCIETSVVNSLYEDDDALLLQNANELLVKKPQISHNESSNDLKNEQLNEKLGEAKSTFVCNSCNMFVDDMNEHECDECEFKSTHHDHQHHHHHQYTIFMCHLCSNNQDFQSENFYKYKQNSFRYFDDLNALREHFDSQHCQTKKLENISESVPPITSEHVTINSAFSIPNNISKKNCDMIKLLDLLAHNDGTEQYACGLCMYVCYHLPSLKSHMWTHVKNEKFDYSINTSIINAALDYENKINRSLALINNSIRFRKSFSSDDSKEDSDSSSCESDDINFCLDKKISDALEVINFKQMEKNYSNIIMNNDQKINQSIVVFRCSKCGFETVDLCILRIHKRNHLK